MYSGGGSFFRPLSIISRVIIITGRNIATAAVPGSGVLKVRVVYGIEITIILFACIGNNGKKKRKKDTFSTHIYYAGANIK